MKDLAKQLAEANLRGAAIRQLHQKAIARIPEAQETAIARIAQLRQQIKDAGIGRDTAAEDEYLTLLHHQNLLENSYTLGDRDDAVVDEKLEKMIRYGQLLLDVYSDGIRVLRKGAIADIESVARSLSLYPVAQNLAQKLMQLCESN